MNSHIWLHDPLSSFTFLCLILSIVSFWIKYDIRIWGFLSALSLLFGLLAGRIEFSGVIPIMMLGFLYFIVSQDRYSRFLRACASVSAIILSIAISAHLVPGFNRWQLLDQAVCSERGQPYSLYAHMDKPFVGLFILGFGFPLVTDKKEWGSLFRSLLPVFISGLLILISLACLSNYACWDVKLPAWFFIWMLKNLFFTCVSEEAFFRGFLQKRLTRMLERNPYGPMLSLIAVSILFGLAHVNGGFKYVILAAAAGIFYGYAYQKTQRIEAAILCHFGVNLVHFIFLTYPALAGG
ncbi:MAG: CPBP family intramembrane metalloprotease [Candidatus Aureabacteria bacterium]|nr:CPBP family intramembrane metalloprotease [Candidatus Auribacterota bacterium]